MRLLGKKSDRHSPAWWRASVAPITACTLALLCTTSASAAQSATLHATLKPERLGQPTAVTFAFAIKAPGGAVPSPLSAVSIRYPAGLGIATSGLGVASCERSVIERSGAGACPADSRMGSGSAELRFAIGPEVSEESARLALIAGPSPSGLEVLIAATGTQPVAARVLMSTLLEGGALAITVPAVGSLPEGPNVAIVSVHATLGGQLTYRELVHGHSVAYRPHGIGLPARCPAGGFRFSAAFTFADGSRASARTTVPCPRA